ncbi:MAG: DNA repair protein RadC [Akkermansia sp.]|nr:DNA repair protein RadC [Akkermansia sp.]
MESPSSVPEEQLMPREKMLRHGRNALSDEELIALFLHTGLQGCPVLELSARIKKAAGSLANLGSMDAREIMECCKGIGPAKATTLAAAFELGQRAVRENLERAEMRSPRTVYDYLIGDLRYETEENLVLLLLDSRKQLIRRILIARGTLTSVPANPRSIFRPAIICNAACFIMVHNHPSGDPTPSSADIELTKTIAQCGELMHIPLFDHVILGTEAPGRPLPFYSFRKNNFLH